MSFILKALKKLEEEKSDQRQGAAQLARDILRTSRKTRKSEKLIIPIAVAALLLTGGMLAYFLAGGLSEESPQVATVQSDAPPAAEQKQVSMADEAKAGLRADVGDDRSGAGGVALDDEDNVAAIAGNPRETTKEAVQASQPAVAKRLRNQDAASAGEAEEVARNNREASLALKETAKTLKETAEVLKRKVIVASQGGSSPAPTTAAPARAQKPAAASARPAAKKEDTSARRTAAADSDVQILYMSDGGSAAARSTSSKANSDLGKKGVEEPEVTGNLLTRSPTVEGGLPDLNVSEIHYQYSVKDRLAIVNDLPVMEGTLIEGARVDRILKDRVRFVYNGRYYEVRLD